MLEIKIRNLETGKDELVTKDFISLREVIKWLEYEEKLASIFAQQAEWELYVKRANDGDNMDDVPVPEVPDIPSSTEIFKERLRMIADLFNDKRVTVDALLEGANAMDKIIPYVQTYVMDQYSKNDKREVPGKD
ncbi:hypothetical protein OIT44_02820 [Weissella ceti]|uniref:Uncharacterized protein n=1 Tax=Weissella ceti TaxID=759620 RepID=A0ABT3E447_9LACO|nr:hypothetical protein [Weissella ceti]MCW0953004.1 hypothetical protein [Weissella ceti]QVK11550.1 hypothetical protein KHQ31_04830 [Weissella ceti]